MRVGNNDANHYQIVFDTWHGFLSWSNENTKLHDTSTSWAGAASVAEACGMAQRGLPDDGLQALALSEQSIHQQDYEVPSQQFQTAYAEAGSDVDVARYLSGEQDCMVAYYLDGVPNIKPIATIAIGMSVSSGVSQDTIRKRGMQLVALIEAIERASIQTEIWVDMTSSICHRTKTVRTSIRVKAPGEPFDVGTFMYALTHPSMFRVLGFNSRLAGMPRQFVRHLSPGGGGHPVTEAKRLEDYPEGTIYIPSLSYQDRDTPLEWTRRILQELGISAG